ncbi:MAG: bifunctional (p)ppGpp synthetase/guanosine-3',5'-bis(diphosphate) 3'-pyrophosphohydrolase [Rhodospirillales bacterium]|nr:bifunctional (p)ppGpp synthetase/guanosine-3',5'-bis(diphosphate) 3'-pyrophosphohydrolase [Rhodospirillales bacterium]
MIRAYELVELVKSYDAMADESAINRGYVFAMKAHGTQKRASGDPYFSHPLEVAGILTGFKLDTASILTGLLHDTIEDTDVTREEIQENFGDEVVRLVEGVTKLTRIELQSDSDHSKQAENFRKLVLAMSEDLRVLLVKLADRLHNMRTLHHIKKPEKRKRIAKETMEIYAPLAERIGIQEVKGELENLAFSELNSEAYNSIIKRLEFLREQSGNLIVEIADELKKNMSKAHIKSSVFGREKNPYSVWQKMQRQNIGFEQLSDIMAFRIIVDTFDDCYRTLGVIHSIYRTIPGRFKDFISTPKPNGYQSIHTGVLGPGGQRIEIQIRTRDMHEVAELGVAAHWQYKQSAGKTDGKQYRWLRELLEILEQASGPEEFMEDTKLEMFQDQVFCFTPKGALINLPQGATTVDFAYAVHSEVGDTCVGAKVNGKLMPLRTQLANGDQVDIVTSKAQTPSPTWERFVVTGKARSRIRRFIRHQQLEEYASLGRAILQRTFRQEGFELTDKALEGVKAVFKCRDAEEVCSVVGAGTRTAREVLIAVFPGAKKEEKEKRSRLFSFDKVAEKFSRKKKNVDEDKVAITGLIPGMAVHYAGCCHPLPGDRIVGIITTGKGVTIHTIDCDTLGSFGDQPERWLDVAWDRELKIAMPHIGRINVTVLNEPGSLGTLSMAIAKSHGNINNLKITNRSQEFFDLMVDVEVEDVKHLTDIIAALRAMPAINSVARARG